MNIPELPYTPRARKILDVALREATLRPTNSVNPDHLLLALLQVRKHYAVTVLEAMGVDINHLYESLTIQLPPSGTSAQSFPPLGEDLERVLRYALKEATHLGDTQIDAHHLLLGLLYEEQGRAATMLQSAGLTLYDVRQQVLAQEKPAKRQQRQSGQLPLPSPYFFVPLGAMIISGILLWMGMDSAWMRPLVMIFVIGGWITSLCIHEFGHALTAYLGGDQSVRDAGYLTLNPLRYTHPVLSILLPLLFLFMGGIGLPGGAVYINPYALKNDLWRSFVSAAGPLGTILFTICIVWPFFLDWTAFATEANIGFWSALAFLCFLQVTALFFNLIPLPPLDGFGIVAPWLPETIRMQAYRFGNVILLLLIFLLWQGGPVTDAFWTEIIRVVDLLNIPLPLVGVAMDYFRIF
ncbi:MAG: hypothetical protein HC837_05990 [Chloroflexaceae bacterium]|nr:hypothetical protein [Chloroflexaceae bacterium]